MTLTPILSTSIDLAEQVFVTPNRLVARFAQAERFCVVETVFGNGLNFLVTLTHWLENAPKNAELHYIAIEKTPFSAQEFAQLHQAHPHFADLFAPFLADYPTLLPGWHDIVWQNVRLTLWFGEALEALTELDVQVDAWFLTESFSKNAVNLQQPALLQQLARLSAEKTTFAALSDREGLYQALQSQGFALETAVLALPPSKTFFYGHLKQARSFSSKAPWFERPSLPLRSKTVVVIGAGLAGAAVAHELAQAGFQVTVLERAEQVAQQASGNLAGALHPLLTTDWNLRSQWYALGLAATREVLSPWLAKGEVIGALSGLVDLAADAEQSQRMHAALSRLHLPTDFVHTISTQTASAYLGIQVTHDGLFFAQGGWLNPPSIVARCLQSSNIDLHLNETVTGYGVEGEGWRIDTRNRSYHAAYLVVASGALSELNQHADLPIRPVKGQVSHLRADQQSASLKCAMSHLGYSAPYVQGQAVTGATFEAPCLQTQLSVSAHQTNLDLVGGSAPDWICATADQLDGRIAFRPTTPDHLPIIGPLADPEWLEQAYLSQSPSHPVFRYAPQRYLPGLYVSNGHGARGLLSVFLAAKMIRADILGETACMPRQLYQATHPARFAIRAWRRAPAPKEKRKRI